MVKKFAYKFNWKLRRWTQGIILACVSTRHGWRTLARGFLTNQPPYHAPAMAIVHTIKVDTGVCSVMIESRSWRERWKHNSTNKRHAAVWGYETVVNLHSSKSAQHRYWQQQCQRKIHRQQIAVHLRLPDDEIFWAINVTSRNKKSTSVQGLT